MQDYSLAKRGAMSDTSNEPSLVAAARLDPAAFAKLYRRYVHRVYRYIFSHVGESAVAEDLTSQVFSAVWEGLWRYREQGNFTAWLFRIVRNKIHDHFRRHRSHLPLEDAEGRLRDEGDLLSQVEHSETLRRLSELVDGLNEEGQELLRLRFAGDLTYAEIGEVLGRSEGAVKMAVHRLLRQLQAQWEQDDE